MEDFKKITEEMETIKVRLDKYLNDFINGSNGSCSVSAAVPSSLDNPNHKEAQRKELDSMQLAFTKLKNLVDSAMVRLVSAEKKIDDLEQYGRSNCLIVHGCKEVPKSGKYLETKNYICKTLNTHLSLDNPLQVKDLDVADALPAKKGTPIIVKFLRRYQRNEIYAKKRSLKNSGLVITESLTKRRLQLLEAARTAFGLRSTWTLKGEVYAFFNNKKLHINDFKDIAKFKNLSTYAAVANSKV